MFRSAFLSIPALVALGLPAEAASYVVCDNGLRCIRAPCPSSNALDVRTRKTGPINGVDLSGLRGGRDRASQAVSNGAYVLDGDLQTRRVRGQVRGERESVLVVRNLGRKATRQEQRLCRSGTAR